MRLTEAPAGMIAKNVTWAPVCIVQGPTEPKSLHDVLAAIRGFFARSMIPVTLCFTRLPRTVMLRCIRSSHGTCTCACAGRPGSEPLLVDNGGERPLKVWPVLCCAEGDIPWLTKLRNSIGHAGVHACYDCSLEGSYHHGAKTVRYVSSLQLNAKAIDLYVA